MSEEMIFLVLVMYIIIFAQSKYCKMALYGYTNALMQWHLSQFGFQGHEDTPQQRHAFVQSVN